MRYSERSWWQAEHVLEAYKVAVAETTKEYADQCSAAQQLEREIRQRTSLIHQKVSR